MDVSHLLRENAATFVQVVVVEGPSVAVGAWSAKRGDACAAVYAGIEVFSCIAQTAVEQDSCETLGRASG